MTARRGRPPLPEAERRRRRAEASRRTTERERAGKLLRSLLLSPEQHDRLDRLMARGGYDSASALVEGLIGQMED